MVNLSVNVNKIATLRNARGGNLPNVLQVALDCEKFGANGITVHPRPDERHITRADVYELRPAVHTEFNIEGFPDERYMDIVLEVRPNQATLVPDAPGVLTSSQGWPVKENENFLREIVARLKQEGIRVSIFVDALEERVRQAARVGADRVELYTGPYAEMFTTSPERAVEAYHKAVRSIADTVDYDFMEVSSPGIDRPGLENTIAAYKKCLQD